MLSENEKSQLIRLYDILSNDLILLAKAFNISEKELDNYFIPEAKLKNQNYLYRLASSLQNSGMMHNSIKFNDDEKRRKQIEAVLCNWNIKLARKKLIDVETIYANFEQLDNGTHSKETNWEKYCKGLYDGLQFLDAKNGIDEINSLINYKFTEISDEFSKLLKRVEAIEKQIYGLGFALTCDWLKECGCEWLAKPDVHIMEVVKYFKKKEKISNKEVLEFIFDWSKLVNSTSYKIDKIIWLLCTGNFYLTEAKFGRSAIYKEIDKL